VRDDWSEHRPTADEENAFIERHGYAETGKWRLGINDEKGEQTKGRYEFPYGDSRKSTAAVCWRRKAVRANTSISTSRMPQPVCFT
jgi:hypothetical protein